MIWHVAGLTWIVLTFLWGCGLTLLVVPRRWRRFWPAFCGPVGLALQSGVVWVGAHTALRGTDAYGLTAALLPVVFGLAAWWRSRAAGGVGNLLFAGRRWGAVFALMAASLVVQCYPFTKPPSRLTSVALSSCDAADYAAGARVFKEFSRDDREGFLGENGRDPMISADHFFTFWLRINHFSPSALIALHATLSGRQPYELTSLFGAVLLALGLPGVFWLARAGYGFRPTGALAVAALYGFSPILFYAMYQTALGQLLAAPAVALLTWAGLQAYRAASVPFRWRRLAAWSGLLLTGDWLLFGGYNFFILFAYIPTLTLVGVTTLRERRWTQAARWAGLVGANILLCSILFPERVVSIVERFRLFNQTPFGWSIPGFWPTGWYGAFGDLSLLTPSGSAVATVVAGTALAAAVGSTFWRVRRGQWRTGLLAAGCTLPILFGYWYLLRQETLHHDRSSYDAFKLFTVFYPGILVSLCLSLRGDRRPGAHARLVHAATGVLWVALLAINLSGISRFNALLRQTPLVVGPDLVALGALETIPDVPAVNIRLPLVWDRLWANCFLLRKPQYIPLPTYEGRPTLPPRALWDLAPRFPDVQLDGTRDPLATNGTFTLLDRRSDHFVELAMDRDWFPIEHYHEWTWYWGKEHPQIRVDNPHPGSLHARLRLALHGTRERHLSLFADERLLWEGIVGIHHQEISGLTFDLPPGTSYLRFVTPELPGQPSSDARVLTFQLEGFMLEMPDVRTSR